MNKETKEKLLKTAPLVVTGLVIGLVFGATFLVGGPMATATVLTFPGTSYTYAMANWEFFTFGAIVFFSAMEACVFLVKFTTGFIKGISKGLKERKQMSGQQKIPEQQASE